MFTGLVETTGIVTGIERIGPGILLSVGCPVLTTDAQLGDSVSVSGCCLTIVSKSEEGFQFEAGEETLQRTILGGWTVGTRINLERSVRVGDRLGGHFVSGHIDCVGTLTDRSDDGAWSNLWFELPHAWMRHLVSKGCIAVDGVSLTVVDVCDDRFSVALIPHTLQETTLGERAAGDPVNIETDLLAKYVERSQAWGSPTEEHR